MRILLLVAALALTQSGCSLFQKKAPPPPPSPPRKAVPVDAQAQKKSYDAGVAAFGEERYEDAQKHWRESMRIGPATQLGKRSAENLAKVDAILARLRQLEKK